MTLPEYDRDEGLDGNAIAGLLFDVFGTELTMATYCASLSHTSQ